jgi:hypothetical protein
MNATREYIDMVTAREIKNLNIEYLLWADGSEITETEIMHQFRIVEYADFSVNLKHKKDDFVIENIDLY